MKRRPPTGKKPSDHETSASATNAIRHNHLWFSFLLASFASRSAGFVSHTVLLVVSCRILCHASACMAHFPTHSPDATDDIRGSVPGVSKETAGLVGHRDRERETLA